MGLLENRATFAGCGMVRYLITGMDSFLFFRCSSICLDFNRTCLYTWVDCFVFLIGPAITGTRIDRSTWMVSMGFRLASQPQRSAVVVQGSVVRQQKDGAQKDDRQWYYRPQVPWKDRTLHTGHVIVQRNIPSDQMILLYYLYFTHEIARLGCWFVGPASNND
jgi:hypothetical protein